MQQKTIEFRTCVSNKDLSRIPNPLDLIYKNAYINKKEAKNNEE